MCSISDSFQRCLLGSSHLLGVLLQGQGQGHGGAPSASKDTRTVVRWPGNEAGFDVYHGNCAYRELEGCFMQDEYCQTQSSFTDLVTLPSTLITPLAVLQALTYLAIVFGDFTCLCYLKRTKLFSLMLFLTKKRVIDSTLILLTNAIKSHPQYITMNTEVI